MLIDARLEEWAKVSDQRMARIEDKLDQLSKNVGTLPSRTDLLTGYGIVVAIIALVFAGMSWLDGRQAARAVQYVAPPTAVSVPASPASPAPPSIIIQTAPAPQR